MQENIPRRRAKIVRQRLRLGQGGLNREGREGGQQRCLGRGRANLRRRSSKATGGPKDPYRRPPTSVPSASGAREERSDRNAAESSMSASSRIIGRSTPLAEVTAM